MCSRSVIILALTASLGFADTITLRNGRVIDGTYLGGTARQVRIAAGDQVQAFDISDVQRIEFGNPAPAVSSAAPQAANPAPAVSSAPSQPASPAPADDNDRPLLRRNETVMRPDPAAEPVQAQAGTTVLPAGTNLVVRVIEGVNSDTNRVGQTFAAAIDAPVAVNGETVIARGADVVLKLVDSKDAGTFTGRAEMALSLVSVRVNGRLVDVNTQTVSRTSSARGQDTAKRAAGVGALGAVIGAIAGGGKGAAIGATTGGAVGAGSEAVTKGPQVKIPSETRLTFVLDTPVNI